MTHRTVDTQAQGLAPELGILVVAHAPSASALQALVAHVEATWLPRICVFDMDPATPRDDASRRIAALITERGWTRSLVLVDLGGSGPFLAAVQAIRPLGSGQARIVTGCNAAMLLSLLGRPPFSDLTLAARYARSRGRRAIAILEVGRV